MLEQNVTASVTPPCTEWSMQVPFIDAGSDGMRAAWWWSGTDLWERISGGGVRRYLPWGTDFGCWRWTGAAWEKDVPAAPVFDRRGTWLDPAGPCDDAWLASCAARAAYFSGIPWALRAKAAREDAPWLFLMEEAARLFGRWSIERPFG